MSESFTFLFAPLEGLVGHVNPQLGIAQRLLTRGHKVVFALPSSWKEKLEAMGFGVECLAGEDECNSKESWRIPIGRYLAACSMTPIQRLEHVEVPIFRRAAQTAKTNDGKYKQIVANVKPDVIIADLMVQHPSLMNAGNAT